MAVIVQGVPTAAALSTSAKDSVKMPLVKKFGTSVGMSVIASNFAVALPGAVPSTAPPLMVASTASAASAATPASASSAHDAGLLDLALDAMGRYTATAKRAGVASDGGAGVITGGTGAPERAAERAAAARELAAMSNSIAMSSLAFRAHAPGASITSLSMDVGTNRAASGGNDGKFARWLTGSVLVALAQRYVPLR